MECGSRAGATFAGEAHSIHDGAEGRSVGADCPGRFGGMDAGNVTSAGPTARAIRRGPRLKFLSVSACFALLCFSDVRHSFV